MIKIEGGGAATAAVSALTPEQFTIVQTRASADQQRCIGDMRRGAPRHRRWHRRAVGGGMVSMPREAELTAELRQDGRQQWRAGVER